MSDINFLKIENLLSAALYKIFVFFLNKMFQFLKVELKLQWLLAGLILENVTKKYFQKKLHLLHQKKLLQKFFADF